MCLRYLRVDEGCPVSNARSSMRAGRCVGVQVPPYSSGEAKDSGVLTVLAVEAIVDGVADDPDKLGYPPRCTGKNMQPLLPPFAKTILDRERAHVRGARAVIGEALLQDWQVAMEAEGAERGRSAAAHAREVRWWKDGKGRVGDISAEDLRCALWPRLAVYADGCCTAIVKCGCEEVRWHAGTVSRRHLGRSCSPCLHRLLLRSRRVSWCSYMAWRGDMVCVRVD